MPRSRRQRFAASCVVAAVATAQATAAPRSDIMASAESAAERIIVAQQQETRWRPEPWALIVGGVLLSVGLASQQKAEASATEFNRVNRDFCERRPDDSRCTGQIEDFQSYWRTANVMAIAGGVLIGVGLIGRRVPVSEQRVFVAPRRGGLTAGGRVSW